MKSIINHHNPLISGTLILTLSGLLSRVIGFFYRIFLSRTIGAEGLGIYQLIFPVLALSVSLTASGIQTSISKFVAEEIMEKAGGKARQLACLYAGLMLSLMLSAVTGYFLWSKAPFIAESFIHEARCTSLVQIVAFSLPFSSLHSCINGYYYGIKKAMIPSVSQLLEQFVRCGCVYLIYLVNENQGVSFSVEAAVWGIVGGEIASSLFSLTALGFRRTNAPLSPAFKKIGLFAFPLTANKVALNLFSSIEAILIPMQLRAFGYNSSDALSVFGILTGMAYPMIMFPTVLTGSISVMLLPEISEAKAKGDSVRIRRTIKKTIESCVILGLLSTLFFFITGSFIGNHIFANTLSGTYIRALSWISPFLYLSSTLCSILHGLGKPALPFLLNSGGCLTRILFILFFVPVYGIRAYLAAMLLAQCFISLTAVWLLLRISRSSFHSNRCITSATGT